MNRLAMRSISLHTVRLVIFFFCLLISSPSIRAQCSMSTVSVESVGSVPNNPFQAEVVTPTPPSPGSANFRFPPFPMLIARDGQGRVRYEFRGEGDAHDGAAHENAFLITNRQCDEHRSPERATQREGSALQFLIANSWD